MLNPAPTVERIRLMIEKLATPGTVRPRSDGSLQEVRNVSVPSSEGEALARWVRREKARHTIEIGLAYGMSALHICQALVESGDSDLRHVVIDPFQSGFHNAGLQALEDAGVSRLIEFHGEMSQITLPRFLQDGRQFDFAFVDGNHRFDSVFVDLFYLGRLVRKGGVIFLDDYQLPGIRRAANFFVTNLNWRVEEHSTAEEKHHWVVLRTSEEEDNRDFRYFEEF